MSYPFRDNRIVPAGIHYVERLIPAHREDEATELARAFKQVPKPSFWTTKKGRDQYYIGQARAIVTAHTRRNGYTEEDKQTLAQTAKLAGPIFNTLRRVLRTG